MPLWLFVVFWMWAGAIPPSYQVTDPVTSVTHGCVWNQETQQYMCYVFMPSQTATASRLGHRLDRP